MLQFRLGIDNRNKCQNLWHINKKEEEEEGGKSGGERCVVLELDWTTIALHSKFQHAREQNKRR